MEYWHDYIDLYCPHDKTVSQEGYDFFTQKYFSKLQRRIAFCENIEPKDELVFYTLAQLYDRVDVDGPKENRYKRKARYYAIKAIRINQRHSKAWALLAETYSWVSVVGGSEEGDVVAIYFSEKAINCIKKAIKYDPENKKYREDLKGYYHLRNEEYKC